MIEELPPLGFDRVVDARREHEHSDLSVEQLVDLIGDGRSTLLIAAADDEAASAAARRTGATLVERDSPTGPWRRRTPSDGSLESLHRSGADPWGVDTRWYERRKRALTLAVLPRERFGRALEVGCSVGALTADLAARCDGVVALDASPAALRAARRRLDGLGHVDVRQADVPAEWPSGRFDLVVVSEMAYFLSPAALDRLAERIGESLTDDGVVVACHWRHEIEGWVLDGASAHAHLVAELGLTELSRYDDRDITLSLLGPDGALPDPTT